MIEAIGRLTPVDAHLIDVRKQSWLLRWGASARSLDARGLPVPTLTICVGRATQAAALAARRRFGGRAICLMKPHLPIGWFDLCLIPMHDNVPQRDNVIPTRGALNPMTAATAPRDDRGLILIGGPSRQFDCNDTALIEQITTIAGIDQTCQWTLTTARRTPEHLTQRLRELQCGNVTVVPFDQTPLGWVAEQLNEASRVWVTEDSVSMVSEALTAGASVGLLPMPLRSRPSRVVEGVRQLIRDGYVTPFETWTQTHTLAPPPQRLDEANRCAALIVERFLTRDHGL